MKRSLLNHCDVPSKHQKGVCFETFDFCEWDFAASQPTTPPSQPATPTSLMPDGCIHLGDDMMLAIREVLIVVNSDDIRLDDDEADIQAILKNNPKVLKKHILHKLDTLKIMCEGCSSDDNQSKHTCFETRLSYMDRSIPSMDIYNLAHDFVYDNSQLYPYMSDSFIDNLNALELFEMCKFHLSVNL
ncbi:hypothetical protein AVEN_63576-1 [Araneus ventricosus]|uniref:Uncharacterized protein n=1 Tax=Araneus ventricosus TaxID=182803 RepID=A0A4Y2GQW8_ARAVE|nr:hypothetical protein AVEN_56305-1 [Araneus ventricosus]GBM55301.1 hypothetical protein AVEN_63576-1 [Araneus ventricosus]